MNVDVLWAKVDDVTSDVTDAFINVFLFNA